MLNDIQSGRRYPNLTQLLHDRATVLTRHEITKQDNLLTRLHRIEMEREEIRRQRLLRALMLVKRLAKAFDFLRQSRKSDTRLTTV